LTQLVFQRAEAKGYKLQTIRYREVGYQQRSNALPHFEPPDIEKLKLQVDEYPASSGTELFVAYENQDFASLVGYLRLRIPNDGAHRPEIKFHDAALLRELHVYGRSLSIGKTGEDAWQHRGVGTSLLETAEEIAKEKGRKQIVCTSGIGARPYYQRYGYQHDGPYMTKHL
jgi:elongator complex protein 3